MTGDIPPPTRKTLEEQIALFVGALLAAVSSLIDVTPLPSTARRRLHEAFAELFARFEAHFIAMVHQARAQYTRNQLNATTQATTIQAAPPPASAYTAPPPPTRRPRTKTTPLPTAPAPTSAPTAESPTAEAPPQKRAPAPHYPPRAPSAVARSTLFTRPSPKIFQKAAFTTPSSHAHFVAIT